MLDGALALPEYIIEFDFSPEMGKVRPAHRVHSTVLAMQWSTVDIEGANGGSSVSLPSALV